MRLCTQLLSWVSTAPGCLPLTALSKPCRSDRCCIQLVKGLPHSLSCIAEPALRLDIRDNGMISRSLRITAVKAQLDASPPAGCPHCHRCRLSERALRGLYQAVPVRLLCCGLQDICKLCFTWACWPCDLLQVPSNFNTSLQAPKAELVCKTSCTFCAFIWTRQ